MSPTPKTVSPLMNKVLTMTNNVLDDRDFETTIVDKHAQELVNRAGSREVIFRVISLILYRMADEEQDMMGRLPEDSAMGLVIQKAIKNYSELTGQPQAIASSGGKPKPSYNEGNTNNSALL